MMEGKGGNRIEKNYCYRFAGNHTDVDAGHAGGGGRAQ
jgi:hypothetical protein